MQFVSTSFDPQVFAAILGAVIAGLFAFLVGWFTHKRERERNDRQWHREKLLETYSNCIYYLVKVSISSLDKSTKDKDVRQHFSETQRYLNLLQVYQSDDENGIRLKECCKSLADNWDKTHELSDSAESALEIVKNLFEYDKLVNVASRKTLSAKTRKTNEDTMTQ